jgi:hypothetical protein
MQTALSSTRAAVVVRPARPQARAGVRAAAVRPGAQARACQQQKQQQQESALSAAGALAPLAAALLPLAAPLMARAEEAAAADAPAAEQSPLFWIIAFLPLLIYALFTLYRDRVNP